MVSGERQQRVAFEPAPAEPLLRRLVSAVLPTVGPVPSDGSSMMRGVPPVKP
jgi:hypothetical protein